MLEQTERVWSCFLDKTYDTYEMFETKNWPAHKEAAKPTPGGIPLAQAEDPDGDSVSLASSLAGIYAGPKFDTHPRRLTLDNRLTPLERHAWIVLQLLFDNKQKAAPKYEDLQAYLSQRPGSNSASRDSVSRVLSILRMTGWLTLVGRGRNPHTGRLMGNIYTIFGEPISAAEHQLIDPSFADLVEKNLRHPIKAVRTVARIVIKEIEDEKKKQSNPSENTSRTPIPSRLEILISHAIENLDNISPNIGLSKNTQSELRTKRKTPSPDFGLSEKHLVRTSDSVKKTPSPNFGLGRKANEINAVRTSDSYSTSTVLSTYTCTVLYRDADNVTSRHEIEWPEFLDDLITGDDKIQALRRMEHIEPKFQEQALHELAARCADNTVRKPLGYLAGIVKKIETGEFKLWLGSGIERGEIRANQPKINHANHSENQPRLPLFSADSDKQPQHRTDPRTLPQYRKLMESVRKSGARL